MLLKEFDECSASGRMVVRDGKKHQCLTDPIWANRRYILLADGRLAIVNGDAVSRMTAAEAADGR